MERGTQSSFTLPQKTEEHRNASKSW